MKHSLSGAFKIGSLSFAVIAAGLGVLVAQEPEVPVSTYLPRGQEKQLEEIPLYDVSNVHPETMIANWAYWTRGTTGLVQAGGHRLPSTEAMQLLTEDPAQTYELPSGKLSVTLDLGDFYSVNEFIFYSVNAKGLVSMEYSSKLGNDKPTVWKKLIQPVNYGEKDTVSIPTNGVDMRYIRITFNTYEPGAIANLSMLGSKPININGTKTPGALENFAANEDEVYERNLAALNRGTSITHVSSGDLTTVSTMIDNDFRTGYAFDEEDGAPVWVAKLSEEKDIDRVSVLAHSNHPGTVEFYVVDSMPEADSASVSTESGAHKVTLPPDFFTKNKPFYTEEVHPHSDWRVSSGSVKGESTGGQYIVMRWVPMDGASTKGDPLIVKQVFATKTPDLQNPEIAAYAFEVQSLNTQLVQGGTGGYGEGGGISTVDRIRLPQLPVVSK